jgi:hypothetical protein
MSVIRLVGSTVALAWSSSDEANATLTITQPDGSELTPTTSRTESAHSASFLATLPGVHRLRWETPADAYADVVDVWPEEPRYLVSKADAHARLTAEGGALAITSSKWDALPLYIAAATWMVEGVVGPMLPVDRTWSEVLRSPSRAILLPAHDFTLVSVTVDGSEIEIDPNDVDESAGIVHGDFLGKVIVTYRPSGVVPPPARLACLEIVAHSWQGTRQSARPNRDETPMVQTSKGYYIPYRAAELLEGLPSLGGIA